MLSPTGSSGVETDEAGVTARECGDRTCEQGSVCCNASCGICTAPGNVCIQIACEPEGEGETCRSLSCAGDAHCMETPAGAQCVPAAMDPCGLVDCPANSTCKVEMGAAACVSRSNTDAGQPAPKDAGLSAPRDAGSSPVDAGKPLKDAGAAIDAGGGPEPVDAGTSAIDAAAPKDATVPPVDAGLPPRDSGIQPVPCSLALCPTGTYCDDISGTAECLPNPTCATVRCSAGYHCELQPVVCVRAPCPQRPACVPDNTDPCGGKCKANTHCEVTPLQCITYPCEQTAQCVPDRNCGCCSVSSNCYPKAVACLDVLCPVANPEL